MKDLSLDREIEFMCKYNLTSDELFFMRLIFYAQDGDCSYINKFFSHGKIGMDCRDILISLQSKGIINKSYKIPNKGDIFNPIDVDFNKTILKSFLQHSQELGMELFMAYPSNIEINGKIYSLRNIAKVFKSMDEFCFTYGKIIKFDEQKHKEILDILEYAKENNLVKSGITDFIISMKWLDYQKMKEEAISEIDNIELI